MGIPDRCRVGAAMGKHATAFPETLILPLVEHAVDESPKECCGLIVVSHLEELKVVPLTNRSTNPEHEFVIGWWDIIRSRLNLQHNLHAVYHSHPRGPRFLSSVDKELVSLTKLDMILIDLAWRELLWYCPTKKGPRVTATHHF